MLTTTCALDLKWISFSQPLNYFYSWSTEWELYHIGRKFYKTNCVYYQGLSILLSMKGSYICYSTIWSSTTDNWESYSAAINNLLLLNSLVSLVEILSMLFLIDYLKSSFRPFRCPTKRVWYVSYNYAIDLQSLSIIEIHRSRSIRHKTVTISCVTPWG